MQDQSQLIINTVSLEELRKPDFWTNLYLKNVKPFPKCDLCEKSIDDPQQWWAFTCDCKLYYHKECVYSDLSEMKCLNCSKSVDIYAFPRFIAKYYTPEQYQAIYQKSIANICDKKDQLDFYRIWFEQTPFAEKPLLDLYTYLEPHSSIKTMDYIKKQITYEGYSIKSFDPAINVDIIEEDNDSNIKIEYDTDKIDYEGQKVLVDLKQFREKLEEYSYGLLDQNFPFFSDYVCLVGGAVHKCLESRIKLEDCDDYSDLDIFICHPDVKVINRESKKIIKYFQDKFDQKLFFAVTGNKIKFLFPGYNRTLRLVLFKNKIDNIMSYFDFSHVQFLYNGKTILTTLEGIYYGKHLISIYTGNYDHFFPKKEFKAKKLKLCMLLPNHEINLNLPEVCRINVWYPLYTDSLDKVEKNMKNTFGIRKKCITEGKPFRIHYSKLPIDFRDDYRDNYHYNLIYKQRY